MAKVTLNSAKRIMKKLNIDPVLYPVKGFREALEIELEHGRKNKRTNITNDDLIQTGKIALAHIMEIPDYYKRLIKMEQDAEKYWKNRKHPDIFVLPAKKTKRTTKSNYRCLTIGIIMVLAIILFYLGISKYY